MGNVVLLGDSICAYSWALSFLVVSGFHIPALKSSSAT
jgi:hypothetical protein